MIRLTHTVAAVALSSREPWTACTLLCSVLLFAGACVVGCGASLGGTSAASEAETPMLKLYCETAIEGVDLGFDEDVTGGSHVCPFHVIDHAGQHYATIQLVDVQEEADVVYSEVLREREEGGMFLDWSLVATPDGRVLERQTETDGDFSFSRETLHRRLEKDFYRALGDFRVERDGESDAAPTDDG